ncbi:hypothetical protein KEN49_CDS0068 [Pseudomonas phage vB_Pae3705-KEN49]
MELSHRDGGDHTGDPVLSSMFQVGRLWDAHLLNPCPPSGGLYFA